MTKTPRLRDKYLKEVVPQMEEDFGYKNTFAVPKVEKIVLNIGMGRAILDSKIMDKVAGDLELITGQRPVKTLAKKAISGFKIRAGMPVGLMVTLRGKKMYEFLDKLVSIVLPQVRDFRGVSPKSFDKAGNYNIGISEHTVFPEIEYENVDETYSLEISIITSAKNDEEGKKLLELLGMPFKADSSKEK